MKKWSIIIGFCLLLFAAGCSKDMANRDVYEKSGDTINVNNKREELYNEGGSQGVRNVSDNYGFVRHQKSPIQNDRGGMEHYSAVNREQVANIISQFSTDIPNVNDVATLVTDQEVLIAYSSDTKDRNQTADQVKKTAMSVVPRFYHVYVTDDKNLMRDVENLANMDSTSKNARNSVDNLVKQMKKSPQGNRMSESEDENGATRDDVMNTNNRR
ncbi:YhcN/YlaJ family sporulation lipoprotein [Bacillus sp. OK048]|uniref:YhcN/YlaJ family sporulation lipoprotein n=1 Tax=Bacillus sp. OK048 TaxID=1882761 RepID=UPI0008877BDA|nr:YhcN/YlaJ family sporulation lipoprotein [Bacillus sp. OK048]SDM75234.1 Sporulation lipoprotein YhcN/YlaJ (Spore_YhcN_YlaJ) [Bacillus sp. OK048]